MELGDGHFAEVDEANWPLVKPFKWFLDKNGVPTAQYKQGDQSYTRIQLKMLVFGKRAPRGHAIKNLDGDPLNCVRSNVRMMTLREARALDREVLGPQIRAPRTRSPKRLPKPDRPERQKKKFRLFED